MNDEDVEKISLGEPESRDIATSMPVNYPVIGLPDHLKAKIVGRFKYELIRNGDVFTYRQNHPSGTAEASLQALKNLLRWDAV